VLHGDEERSSIRYATFYLFGADLDLGGKLMGEQVAKGKERLKVLLKQGGDVPTPVEFPDVVAAAPWSA
jgi:hypothetical protein